MTKVKEGSRWEKQYEKTTLVRVSSDTHARIKNLIRPGESIQDVIGRAITLLESGNIPLPDVNASVNGAVNVDVNDIVNTVVERVNADINNKFNEINERLDNLIPGIEHQRDEAGHALEIVFSIQKRLEALEAQPVTVPTLIPDDKPEEQTPGDDTDLRQEQEQDERDILIQKVKELKAGGMKLTQIAQAIGIGHSQLSKLMNREEHPNVNLKPEQKAALMNVPSQKSSPEGT